jgi:3-isopropylmalate/(R)-2-methylmalate dehydratase large subunit
MGVGITGRIPDLNEIPDSNKLTFEKAMQYMNLSKATPMIGKTVDYVFVGSCTNGRIEDLRQFAAFVKGRKKADNITAWIVPGSKQVEKQALAEGIDKVLNEAGFELRQPGCSACLAMNDDKIPEGKYAVSTSNRNFEGRQGPGARTFLASPLTAAAAAITGKITDPREFL